MENKKIITNRNNLKNKVILFLLLINLVVTGGLVAYEFGFFPIKPHNLGGYIFKSQLQIAKKYTIYIGTNDKDTHTQAITTNQAREIVNEICNKYVVGYTSWEAVGGWVDETKPLTQENTLIYSFYDVEEEQLMAVMDEVLDKLNQNAILLDRGEVESMYYEGSAK